MSWNEKDTDCICFGNWRAIINEMEPLFDKEYLDEDGEVWRLTGVLWASDDFYYSMWNPKKRETRLCTCVGSLENQGFKLAS